jgi:hypothetical protein
MTKEQIRTRIDEEYEDVLLADGFEDALVGVVEGWQSHGRVTVVCYDYGECVKVLMAQGMSAEEAEEYLDFNVLGAYAGKTTPVFLHDWRRVVMEE